MRDALAGSQKPARKLLQEMCNKDIQSKIRARGIPEPKNTSAPKCRCCRLIDPVWEQPACTRSTVT